MPAVDSEIQPHRLVPTAETEGPDPISIGATAVGESPMELELESSKPVLSSRKRSTLINLLGLQGIALATIVRNIVLVPLYLHAIGAELYGMWIATAGAAAFMQLADMGLPRMLIQRTAELEGAANRVELGRTIASGLIALILVTLGIVAALLPLAEWLPDLLGVTGDRSRILTLAFRLALLDGGLTLIIYGEGGVLLGLQKPMVPTLALILSQLIGITGTLILLGRGLGLIALPLGMLCGTVVAWVITTFALVRDLRQRLPRALLQFDGQTFQRLFSSSVKIALSRISRVVAFQSPALIVAMLLNPVSVVVLDLSRKSSLLVVDVIGRVMMSLHPGLAHLVGAGEEQKYRRICRLLIRSGYLLSMLGIGGVLALNKTFVKLWTGESYYGGDLLTALICVHLLLQILGVAAYFILISRGLERVITRAALLESALQLGLSVVFCQIWGLAGIAGAAIIAAGAALVIQVPSVNRLCGNDGELRREWPGLSRILVCGTLPLILGIAIRATLEPVDWFHAAVVALVYLTLASSALALTDGQVREILATLFRKLRTRTALP